MIFPRSRFAHCNQRGFTLIELMIVIAIAGLITVGITGAISQLLTVNTRASNHMIAVRQVQQAGKEVSKDTLQAQNIIPTEGAGEYPPDTSFPLSLNWTDWEGVVNVVVYDITEHGDLQRTHTRNDTAEATAPPVVARYVDVSIDPITGRARTNCDWDAINGVLTFTVTATLGTQSETRIYEIEPRPD